MRVSVAPVFSFRGLLLCSVCVVACWKLLETGPQWIRSGQSSTLYRQLAGNDGGLVAGVVVDDLQQVRAGRTVDSTHSSIVENEDISLGQSRWPVELQDVGCLSRGGAAQMVRRAAR